MQAVKMPALRHCEKHQAASCRQSTGMRSSRRCVHIKRPLSDSMCAQPCLQLTSPSTHVKRRSSDCNHVYFGLFRLLPHHPGF